MEKCSKIQSYLFEGLKFQKLVAKVLNESLADLGFNALQGVYLVYLYSNDQGLTLRELTDYTCVDKAQITRISTDLMSKGIIVTDKKQTNERKYRVFLTDTGRKIALDILSRIPLIEEELLCRLTPESKENFIAAMQCIIDFLKQ